MFGLLVLAGALGDSGQSVSLVCEMVLCHLEFREHPCPAPWAPRGEQLGKFVFEGKGGGIHYGGQGREGMMLGCLVLDEGGAHRLPFCGKGHVCVVCYQPVANYPALLWFLESFLALEVLGSWGIQDSWLSRSWDLGSSGIVGAWGSWTHKQTVNEWGRIC